MSTARVLRWIGLSLLLAMVLLAAAATPQSAGDYVYVWPAAAGSLSDGSSVDSLWRCLWLGYGSGGVGSGRLWLSPAASTSPGETHSALVRSSFPLGQAWDIQVPVTTVAQLRTKKIRGRAVPSPNPWEVAWLVANMTDDGSGGLYFIHKANGVELGAYRYHGSEVVFLCTARKPTMIIGQEYVYRLFSDGSTLTAVINGIKVAEASLAPVAGWQLGDKIGLYTEDATVSFGQVQVKTSIP